MKKRDTYKDDEKKTYNDKIYPPKPWPDPLEDSKFSRDGSIADPSDQSPLFNRKKPKDDEE